MAQSEPPAGSLPVDTRRLVLMLVLGQLGLHSCMAGVRMAVALQALREGYGPAAVGLLLALFAAVPGLTALAAGRLTDRLGYHPVVYGCVGLCACGAAAAMASTWTTGLVHLALLCLAAATTGTAANAGVLAIQRTAGAHARSDLERLRIFSWLGVAPPFANSIGPVLIGLAIDSFGFAAGYGLMMALPLMTWFSARQVPRAKPWLHQADAQHGTAWSLLRLPALRRLLVVNWLFSTCWDVHSFVVPLLGHERGYAASTVGLILGLFTLAVAGVRLLIPALAHRLSEAQVVRSAMVLTALVCLAYPWAPDAWVMGLLSIILGMAVGCVQPMVMSMLHQVTPSSRHGDALALRSVAMNATGTVMPLLFGVGSAAVGAGALFWGAGALLIGGTWLPARIARDREGR